MTELKQCPFCSGEASIYHGDSTDGYIKGTRYVLAFCGWCGASIRGKKDDEVIKAWNNRTNPWHTGAPTRSGEYLVCIRYDFGKEGFTTANYIEPFSLHNGWYNIKPPSEIGSAEEWCKKNGIEVIAWQEIEPYKGNQGKVGENFPKKETK